MKNVVLEVLSRQGHNIVVSDLYGQGFSAVAQKWDFVTTSGGHFNYVLEQKHAAGLDNAFSPDILGEIQKIQAAEMIIFTTPLWWFGAPAILKGWFDRVLAMGVAWDNDKIYENGLLRGKQAVLITSAGDPANYFTVEGKHKTTPLQLLHPINHGTLALCGLDVQQPFVALNINAANDGERAQILKNLELRLQHLVDTPQWLIKYQ
jgi:NAD(P)H dehydrogenase (quinone)